MKFRTFSIIAGILGLGVVGAGGAVCVNYMADAPSDPPAVATAPVVAPPPTQPSYAPLPVPTPAPTVRQVVTTESIRADLEAWLTTHADRQGQMQLNNVLPNAPYCANVLRFADEAAAARNQQGPTQWSMFRIDRDRDGRIDEKWLLRGGHTFKREVFGPDGRTVIETQIFSQ